MLCSECLLRNNLWKIIGRKPPRDWVGSAVVVVVVVVAGPEARAIRR